MWIIIIQKGYEQFRKLQGLHKSTLGSQKKNGKVSFQEMGSHSSFAWIEPAHFRWKNWQNQGANLQHKL